MMTVMRFGTLLVPLFALVVQVVLPILMLVVKGIYVLLMLPGRLWPRPYRPVRILRVIDGDTVDVLDFRGRSQRVRLAGIDCPERSQPAGAEATAWVTERLEFGTQVDLQIIGKDRKWNRLVGFIRLPNGDDLSLAIARAGWAWSLPRGQSPMHIRFAVSEAQRSGMGLWHDHNAKAPWAHRRAVA